MNKTIILTSLFLASIGCQKAYYSTMEKLGHPKREILVSRVQDARDSQQEAAEQFESALEQFSTVLNFDGGDLEKKYEKMDKAYKRSKDKADSVHTRIKKVEDVAKALFKEWEEELEDYSSYELKNASKTKLNETQKQYTRLISAMKRAEDKITPVLSAFQDQVLFLKHNLNARAIASLQKELVNVESDVAELIQEMKASIAEANEFIQTMTE